MSTYEPERLLSLWQSEQISNEMAIGHLVQNLILHQEVIKKLNVRVNQVNSELNALTDQIKSHPASKSLC